MLLDTASFYPGPWYVLSPVLQARPPPEDVPNHMTDNCFEIEPSVPVAVAPQHIVVPPTGPTMALGKRG